LIDMVGTRLERRPSPAEMHPGPWPGRAATASDSQLRRPLGSRRARARAVL